MPVIEAEDERFPACCAYCPYRHHVTGSCDHDLRQTLVRGFIDRGETTCSVYRARKTQAMQALLDEFGLDE